MQVTMVGTCPFPPLPNPVVSQTSGYEVVKRVRPTVMGWGEDGTILPFMLSFPPPQQSPSKLTRLFPD